MGIYETLQAEYESALRKNDNGENVENILDIRFGAYSLDAVDTAKRNFQINLDFSEESILLVEKILDMLNKTLDKHKPPEEDIMTMAKSFAGYIGEVIRTKWGGVWVDENEYSIKNGPAFKVNDSNLFLLSKVYRRITNGPEENVWHFYLSCKLMFEGKDEINDDFFSVKNIALDELEIKKGSKLFDFFKKKT